jgi:hypothetical protein
MITSRFYFFERYVVESFAKDFKKSMLHIKRAMDLDIDQMTCIETKMDL